MVRNILTGWPVDLKADPPGFRCRRFAHQPGMQTLMGRRFAANKVCGVAALAFLAGHPAMQRFLATKLGRHFAAGDPPPDAVPSIESVLQDTKGDFRAAATLVALDTAWQPGVKLRTPLDFVVACIRALDIPADRLPDMVGIVAGLGQPLWTAPAPNG